jgi:hypothetical protein
MGVNPLYTNSNRNSNFDRSTGILYLNHMSKDTFNRNFQLLTMQQVILNSVAEPELEPVEQQLFAGAGAKVFSARLRVCKFVENVTKPLNFSY